MTESEWEAAYAELESLCVQQQRRIDDLQAVVASVTEALTIAYETGTVPPTLSPRRGI